MIRNWGQFCQSCRQIPHNLNVNELYFHRITLMAEAVGWLHGLNGKKWLKFIWKLNFRPELGRRRSRRSIQLPVGMRLCFTRICLIAARNLAMVVLLLVHVPTGYSHQPGIAEFTLQTCHILVLSETL